MIIFKDHSFQQSSAFPDTNYIEEIPDVEQPRWVVSDESELADKIKNAPYWNSVEDENGNLIDIEPCEPPVTIADQIAAIKAELEKTDMQVVRPLRAIAAGTATDEDRIRLAELETQAAELRKKLKQMEVDEWTTQ